MKNILLALVLATFCLSNLEAISPKKTEQNKFFAGWWEMKESSKENADKEYIAAMRTFTGLHTRLFSKDNLFRKPFEEEDIKAWNTLFEKIEKFITDQYKKDLSFFGEIKDLWNGFLDACIKLQQKQLDSLTFKRIVQTSILEQLPVLYKKINDDSALRNPTKRALQMLNNLVYYLEITAEKSLKDLSKL